MLRLELAGITKRYRPRPHCLKRRGGPPGTHAGEVALAISGLAVTLPDEFGTSLKGVTLELRAGEIVGVAGVSGNALRRGAPSGK